MQNASAARPAGARGEPEGAGDTRSVGSPRSNAGSPQERMDYVADMLLELKAIVEQAGNGSLGAVLELASREARAGVRRGRAQPA